MRQVVLVGVNVSLGPTSAWSCRKPRTFNMCASTTEFGAVHKPFRKLAPVSSSSSVLMTAITGTNGAAVDLLWRTNLYTAQTLPTRDTSGKTSLNKLSIPVCLSMGIRNRFQTSAHEWELFCFVNGVFNELCLVYPTVAVRTKHRLLARNVAVFLCEFVEFERVFVVCLRHSRDITALSFCFLTDETVASENATL